MPNRQDGKDTRRRLLNAACEVFAQKGYRNAKVSDICRLAGANVAAVNYYFKGKASLYEETWRHAYIQFEEPVFSNLAEGPPKERLREYTRALMKHVSAKGGKGVFSRLYMMELVNPTGLIQETWHELVEPKRRVLHDIIREIAGRDVEEKTVLFCELSIVNQCRALLTIKEDDLEYLLGQPLDAELIERLAHHIADFSLAGIEAVSSTPD